MAPLYALRTHIVCVAVLLITAAAFAPVLFNGFVNWDDPENFTRNWSYRGLGGEQLAWMFTTFHMGHYQPVAWMTLGADYVVWGMNPAGYHLTSLMFHLANAVLVYGLALRLLARATNSPDALGGDHRSASRLESPARRGDTRSADLRAAAAFAAGFFALHPMRVESVAWATARRDVVSGFFFLAAAILYIDSVGAADRCGRIMRRALSVAAFACALMSKSITAMLPALLLVIDIYPLRRLGRGRVEGSRSHGGPGLGRLLIEKLPYAALSIAAIIVGIRAQRSSESMPGIAEFGILDRAAIAAYGLAFYVRKTLVPSGLSPAHVLPARFDPMAPGYLAGMAFALIATASVLALSRRLPWLAAAWTAYVIALLPVLGIAQVWRQFVAVRYSYLACVGCAVLAGGVAWWALRRRGRARAEFALRGGRLARALPASALAAILVALALLTAGETRAWRDGETLWKHAIAADPRNHLAHTNLGGFYASVGRTRDAEAEFREALRAHPRFGDALGGLGTLAVEAGRLDEAESLFVLAIDSQPVHPSVVSNLGVLRMRRGEIGPAIAAFEEAIAMHATYFDAWQNLGGALESAGEHERAAAALREAVSLNPQDANARRLFAASLFHAGQRAEALEVSRENVRRDPLDVYSANIAAWILATAPEASLRDGGAAARIAAAALAPASDPPAYLLDTYAAALAEAGRFDEAVGAATKAIDRALAEGDSAQARLSRERLARYSAREAFRDTGPPIAGR